MERTEFKRIDQYIEDVEKNLEQLGTQSIAPERNLTKLHLVIERLMHISGDIEDQQLRSSLGTLEHRARRCMQCIQARHTDRN
jgi:hypothetical protein